MLEAVSVAPRQLLVLDPFEACEALFQPLQAAGWSVQRCTPQTFNGHAGDALLLYLNQQPSHALLKQLQLTGLGCIVLMDAERVQQINSEELVGEWCFAALTLPVELPRLLETLQLAQTGTRLRRLKSARQVPQFLGNCAAARSLRRQLDRLSRIDGPLFISGERGSGKHLLARLLHQRSSLLRRPCALSIAPSLSKPSLSPLRASPTCCSKTHLGSLRSTSKSCWTTCSAILEHIY
ncbi:sigma 54-interacting transcriptional regulator [Pseudomonas sp. MDMC_285]|nr:sigma 54-interacting transcriptional regulator [Pseudomonas sp. MDMC_285]